MCHMYCYSASPNESMLQFWKSSFHRFWPGIFQLLWNTYFSYCITLLGDFSCSITFFLTLKGFFSEGLSGNFCLCLHFALAFLWYFNWLWNFSWQFFSSLLRYLIVFSWKINLSAILFFLYRWCVISLVAFKNFLVFDIPQCCHAGLHMNSFLFYFWGDLVCFSTLKICLY